MAQGYRAPQATELFRLQAGQQVADLEAEELTSIEAGWRFDSDKFALLVSLYHMQKDNFIFQDSNRQNISNGETKHRGSELSLTYKISNSTSLSGQVAYAKHTYSSDINISQQSIKGNEIDTAPKIQAGAQLVWQPNNALRSELEWVKMGNYFLDPENTAEYDGHDLLHLRTSYVFSDQLTISLNILNISDEDYAERADLGFGNYRYFVGEPRSLFASLSYQIN